MFKEENLNRILAYFRHMDSGTRANGPHSTPIYGMASPSSQRFLHELIEHLEVKTHLDPALSPGTPSLYTENLDSDVYEIFNLDTDWLPHQCSEGLKLIPARNNHWTSPFPRSDYDLITWFPPLLHREFSVNPREHLNTLKKLTKSLGPSGRVITLVTSQYVRRWIEAENKEESELFVNAVFQCPPSKEQRTSIHQYLVVLSQEQNDDVFCARIDDDQTHWSNLLKGYHTNRNTKSEELGFTCPKTRWHSYESEVYRIRYHKTANKRRFRKLDFNLAFSTRTWSGEELAWEDIEIFGAEGGIISDTLWFTFERLPATKEKSIRILDNQHPMVRRGKDHTKAFVLHGFSPNSEEDYDGTWSETETKTPLLSLEFLKYYFTTDLGRLFLLSLNPSNMRTKGNGSIQFNDLFIFLPEYNQQVEIVEAHHAVTMLNEKIKDYSVQLGQAENVKAILQKLRSMDPDSMDNWINTLPYPLSSILWSWHATEAPKEKFEYLSKFFEALALFLDTLIISAFAANPEYFEHTKSDFVKKNKGNIKRPDFGYWTQLYRVGQKAMRLLAIKPSMQSDNKSAEWTSVEILGVESGHPFFNLFTPKLIQIFEDAAEIRNKQQSHGGIINNTVAEELLPDFDRLLSRTQEVVGYNFLSIELITPLANTMNWDGVSAECTVSHLHGSSSQFPQKKFTSITPVATGSLYFSLSNSTRPDPFELAPFVRFTPNDSKVKFYARSHSPNELTYVAYNEAVNQEKLTESPDQKWNEWVKRLQPSDA